MRIVHYHPSAATGGGGPDIAVREWAEALATAGQDVAVVCAHVAAHRTSSVEWIEVGHRGSASRGGRFHRPVLGTDVLRGVDVLVLHSGWVLRNPGAARVARASAVPYVITPHGAYHPRVMARRRISKQLWWPTLEKPMLERSLMVHIFFEEEATHLERAGYVGARMTVPQSVYVPRQARWHGGGGEHMLWFGRFDIEAKGLDLLLRAVASLPPANRPQLRLHGRDWRASGTKLSALVGQLDLERWIEVLPPVYGEDKWSAMEQAAAFVHPSRWDACPMAVLEAAAVGMPLVLTDFPLGAFLARRNAALTVRPTVGALAQALASYTTIDPALGDRARGVMENELSWPTLARRYVGQLERSLTGNTLPPQRA